MLPDFIFAFRSLHKSLGFTLVSVLTLGLGIGASTAMFSVVHSALLRPLPYPEADRIVHVWEETAAMGFPENTPAPANYYDWKAQSKTLEDMTAFRRWAFTLTGEGEAVRIEGVKTTPELFPLLGVKPRLGRVFTAAEDEAGAPGVAIVSYALWRDRFGSDSSLIGKTLSLDGAAMTVIGVMPAEFRVAGYEADIWTPMAFSPEDRTRRGSHFLQVMAKLKPGVTLEQARAEMKGIAKRLELQYPDSNSEVGAVVTSLRQTLSGRQKPMLLALLGIVGFLLLIACANVAGLLVARASARQREFAVRAALGAGRMKLLRLQLVESSVLAALACLLGLALAAWTKEGVSRLLPEALYGAKEIELNPVVLGFSMVAAALTALLSGMAPALLAWRTAEADSLRQGSRNQVGGRAGLRQLLVGAEVTLSVLMLTGAGLFLHSFLKLQRQELGFDPEGLVTMRLVLPDRSYAKDEQRVAFYQASLEKIKAIPGVADAGWTYRVPTSMAGGASMVTFDGRPAPPRGQEIVVPHRYVTPSYFPTMRMRLVEGRLMEARDTKGPVYGVMVNETFARRFFQGRSALDSTFVDSNQEAKCRIIGVVADVREYNIDEPARPVMYNPLQAAPMVRDLVVRTAMEPGAVATLVRAEIRSIDASLAVSHVQPMEEVLSKAVAGPRLQMVLAGIFAVLALLLTGVGLAGVVAQSVVERTPEIGLRMALGAQRGHVLALVFREGILPTGAGLAAGLALSLAMARTVQSLLYGVQAHDTQTFVTVPLVLAGVSLLAMLLPALRALRIEPMSALRGD
ncbi:ABC transporter permease [Paludibaculum fermentans]|uniref:ABC transporter permease n=1 Tax=Paludibaculum fermentans TaxID=1473598 RepID=A0A7S7NKJ6_PALFE|nr:ABC transporter permease [Paludibaculum fermentans]QOY85249.1 ABC transporter permease [Paludibaculum fermentans]